MIVFAFLYNGFIYESAAAVVSLHSTKAGAWRAMRKFMFDMAQDERNFAIQFGGKSMMRDKELRYKAFSVQEMEVLTDGRTE